MDQTETLVGSTSTNNGISSANPTPEEDADDPAGAGERHGLDHELRHDVPVPGAQRLPDADLPRPLPHGDEHDVHDADAADQQRNARDAARAPRSARRGSCSSSTSIAPWVWIDEILLVRVAPDQDILDLGDGPVDVFGPGRRRQDLEQAVRVEQFLAARDGNEHHVVDVPSQARSLLSSSRR